MVASNRSRKTTHLPAAGQEGVEQRGSLRHTFDAKVFGLDPGGRPGLPAVKGRPTVARQRRTEHPTDGDCRTGFAVISRVVRGSGNLGHESMRRAGYRATSRPVYDEDHLTARQACVILCRACGFTTRRTRRR